VKAVGANTVWGIHTVFIAMAGTIIGTFCGAALNAYFARRRQLSDATRSACTRAIAMLNLVRHYLGIDRAYDERIAEIREHLWASVDSVGGVPDMADAEDRVRAVAADRIEDMKERRDRILDHVFRPLLEVQAEFRVIGNAGLDEALRDVTDIIEESLRRDDTPLDDARFDAALFKLRTRIQKELGIRRRTRAEWSR
jgi:hypothetical protein